MNSLSWYNIGSITLIVKPERANMLHPLEVPIVTKAMLKEREAMNRSRINGASPEYLVCFKIYVQASGGVLVVMGNQRLMLSADEVRALLDGVLDYASVFAALNRELALKGEGTRTTTTLETLEKNNI